MKATRLFLAAIALAVASACSGVDITTPSVDANQTTAARGQIGTGS